MDKSCHNCKYVILPEYHEPCRTCRSSFASWEPKIIYNERVSLFDQYQLLTKRTDNNTEVKTALNNFALGIAGESGEVIDLVKKVIFHDHPIDKEKFKSELGDVMWYVARIANWVGLGLEEVATYNIEKLKKRYPEGFDKDKSLNRETEGKA